MKLNNKSILTAKEEEVMTFFWKNGELFVREIVDMYNPPKPHFNTISTIVRGLEEKEFVSHKSFGNTYKYFACVTEEEIGKKSLKSVVGKYFDDSILSAVSTLIKEDEISINELKELINLVEKGGK